MEQLSQSIKFEFSDQESSSAVNWLLLIQILSLWQIWSNFWWSVSTSKSQLDLAAAGVRWKVDRFYFLDCGCKLCLPQPPALDYGRQSHTGAPRESPRVRWGVGAGTLFAFLVRIGTHFVSTSLTIGWLVCDGMARSLLVSCLWEIDGCEIGPFGLLKYVGNPIWFWEELSYIPI